MRKKNYYLVLAFLVIGAAVVDAQVTIGSKDDPHASALLDLKSTTKGLLLPRVSLNDVGVFQLSDKEEEASTAGGMIVYNTNDLISGGNGKGVYVWDGEEWLQAFSSGDPGGNTGKGNISISSGGNTASYLGGSSIAVMSSDCTTTGNWSFVLKAGSAFANIDNSVPSAATIQVDFDANDTNSPRAAVVTVTDPCGNSRDFTFIQASTPSDPGTLETGVGAFSGRTVFDIAYGNDGTNNCGTVANQRANRKTDFTNRTEQTASSSAPYSGVQVYTFKPQTTVSNLRFMYVEEGYGVGRIIEKITPREDYSGNVVGTAELVVEFKESLNNDLRTLTRKNALKAYLYAVYNDAPWTAGNDQTVILTLSLQDCSSCGAYTASGTWLDMMCFNLGSDEATGDPFVYSTEILGDLYQWGRVADGHQKRTSATVAGPAVSTDLDTRGQIKSGNGKFGKFITTSASGTYYDWRTPQDHTLWGNGNQDATMAKTLSDPCPAGWKIPTQKQWAAIATKTNNAWQWTGSGYKVGEALYLPAAGIRYSSNGSLVSVGLEGYYWSSTISSTYAWYLYLYSGEYDTNYGNYRAHGLSVRCVSE